MKNVLILDNDLGFVYWLGSVLIGAKYQPWPACSVSDAFTVVGQRPRIPLDLLVVNPSMDGVKDLISRYRRMQPNIKVMGVGPQDVRNLSNVAAWREKPSPSDDSEKRKWSRIIDRICRSHRSAA
jgi:hypothetical protein